MWRFAHGSRVPQLFSAILRHKTFFRHSPSQKTFFRHSPSNTDHITTFSAKNMSAAFNDSLASRPNEVNLAIVDAGFASLTDVLINEINCFSDHGALGKRAVAFYKQGDCSKLIAAGIGNKRFTSQGHPALIDTVSRHLDREIQVLSTWAYAAPWRSFRHNISRNSLPIV